jgi:hypothetical protein
MAPQKTSRIIRSKLPASAGRRIGRFGQTGAMGKPQVVSFVGGDSGAWHVERVVGVTGPPLANVACLDIADGRAAEDGGRGWVLRGVTSNERYVERSEREALVARQGTGACFGDVWRLDPDHEDGVVVALTQDERRAVIETRSRHIATGLAYLPAIARRLHHGRDLHEPFDFLTWFEFGPADIEAFEELVGRLRETEEWTFVEREVDIRVVRWP